MAYGCDRPGIDRVGPGRVGLGLIGPGWVGRAFFFYSEVFFLLFYLEPFLELFLIYFFELRKKVPGTFCFIY